MFNMQKIGKQIKESRKKADMTQLELADNMGVSYQAVSNWERGNTMPDISKLQQLAELLNISIDDLLSGEKGTRVIKDSVDEEKEMDPSDYSIEEVMDAAPVLKPSQTDSLLGGILDDMEEVKVSDLIGVAPFLDDKIMEHYVNKIVEVESLSEIVGLAPFLDDKYLDDLIRKAVKPGELSEIIGLAPFLGDEILDELVGKVTKPGEVSEIIGLAPFLGEKALDKLVKDAIEVGKIDDLIGLYPFLSDKSLKRISKYIMKTEGVKGLSSIAPFL